MRRQTQNCRPAQIQQRRHDRHMSLDMSSCRRAVGWREDSIIAWQAKMMEAQDESA